MKTLNLIKTAVVILVISILIGCSDQITSSGNVETQSNGKKLAVSETGFDLPVKNVYRVEIRLKPYRSYTFNKSNTPFVKFTAFDIVNIVSPDEDKLISDCQDIKVYSTSVKYDKLLGCHGKGLNLSDITIENTTSQFISLRVELDGVKAKQYIAVDTE